MLELTTARHAVFNRPDLLSKFSVLLLYAFDSVDSAFPGVCLLHSKLTLCQGKFEPPFGVDDHPELLYDDQAHCQPAERTDQIQEVVDSALVDIPFLCETDYHRGNRIFVVVL